MKNKVRQAIVGLLTAAVMTTVFTGCKPGDDTSLDLNTSSTISQTISDTESNSGIGGDPIISTLPLYSDETFDMRYKHWYDNPDVEAAQQGTLKLAQSGTPTGTKQLGTFPLYKDNSGKEYFISGRQLAYVPSNADTHGLKYTRDEDGKFYYPHLTGITDASYLAAFQDATQDDDTKQPTDYSNYVSADFAKFDSGTPYRVFVNNLDTGATYTTGDIGMPITKWLVNFNLASVDTSNSSEPKIYQNTGAGIYTIEFSNCENGEWKDEWMVNYLEEGFELAVDRSEVNVIGNTIYFTPEAIQRVLGYHIQVYKDVINIVTDNKDLADENSAFPSQLPVTVTDPNENQVPAQHTPVVISSSSCKPAQSAPVSKPTNPSGSEGYIGGDPISSGSKPAQSVPSSSKPASSSKPVQSTPTQATPSDTTGFTLDANGCPADPMAWIQKKGTTKFVDSNGQTWSYSPGIGWRTSSPGGMIDDGSSITPSGNIVGH